MRIVQSDRDRPVPPLAQRMHDPGVEERALPHAGDRIEQEEVGAEDRVQNGPRLHVSALEQSPVDGHVLEGW